MRDLWLPNGSPKWIPTESLIQVDALKKVESAKDYTDRFLAVCEWEKVAIQDLEIFLVMARDLAASKTEPHQQASVQDFLDQIGAIDTWWRVSISQQAKGLLTVS